MGIFTHDNKSLSVIFKEAFVSVFSRENIVTILVYLKMKPVKNGEYRDGIGSKSYGHVLHRLALISNENLEKRIISSCKQPPSSK